MNLQDATGSPDALYAAFDIFPSAKGAATHIDRFYTVMKTEFKRPVLFTLGSEQKKSAQDHLMVESLEPNYLKRAANYSNRLGEFIQHHPSLQLIHFRDVWSGLACLQHKNTLQTVFEVNALHSVELPYRFPDLPLKTLEKLRTLEQLCLDSASRIITPSRTTALFLQQEYQVNPTRITVIPNGADTVEKADKPVNAPEKYLLDVLIKVMNYLRDLENLHLVIASSQHFKFSKPYQRLAELLNLQDKIQWLYELDKKELGAWIQHADISIAPLRECSRNLVQGCSPLKIFESLAYGTPVIASDLPPVREILQTGNELKLVRPDRPAELARAVRIWLEYPEKASESAIAGQKLIESQFNWKKAGLQLRAVYHSLLQPAEPSFWKWTA